MAKLYFRYGAMGAGKSAQLVIAAFNYAERGMKPMIFNYAKDTRFGDGVVASRAGMSLPSQPYDSSFSFVAGLAFTDYNVIFVDEAQFLSPQQVKDLHEIATVWNIPVLCYGLRTDFRGNLFEGSAALMAHSETLEELKTICDCGKKATNNVRFIDGQIVREGEVEHIGVAEYKSMCYACYLRGIGDMV